MLSTYEARQKSRVALYSCVLGLGAVLCFIVGISLLSQRALATHARASDRANKLAMAYADVRFWVGQEESLEREYRLEPGEGVRTRQLQAQAALARGVDIVQRLVVSPATIRSIERIERADAAYARATTAMVRAVRAHDTRLVIHLDHAIVDPIFGVVQRTVSARSAQAARTALRESARLRANDSTLTRAIILAFAVGMALIVGFVGILLWLRKRLNAAHEVEIRQLADLATTDPLTGLHNHRAFHEDLTRELQRVGRGAAHLSLILLDLDGIRVVNDTLGHQVGDRHHTSLADALRATLRGSDRAYRTNGDEFAIVLAGERAWGALELAQRLQSTLTALDIELAVTVSAGIADTSEFCAKEQLIHRADLALITAKATGQSAIVYTPELERELTSDAAADRRDTNTLTSALALAVDAKDAYTRSHCQTVSQLCALLATELELDPDRIAQMRVAGLLHDVGKIGVPDAILNKPARLTEEEFAVMRQHSVLGAEIVLAAELPQEARWIRHHHERFDGLGYPDALSGEDIPLESRIILACDAYEAMTSNRAYRDAPGHVFALAELRRHAGTQFDPRVVTALCAALDRRADAPEDGELTLSLYARLA